MAKSSLPNRGSTSEGSLLSSPLAFMIICVIAFGLILAVMMWREGRLFPHLFEASGAQIEAGDRSWMGGGKRASRPVDPNAGRATHDAFANQEQSDAEASAPAE